MHSTTLLTIFLCLPALGLNFFIPTNRFHRVIVFGDSLSDTGNVYQLTNREFPFTPPYYRGQYSNGPIWIDRLAVLFKQSFAYGGATTDNDRVKGAARLNTVPVPGIRQQIATYLNTPHREFISYLIPTLYIIWGGGNDFLNNASAGPPQISSSLTNCVKILLDAGVKNVLVFSQPPGNLSPFGRRLNQPALLAGLVAGINNAMVASFTTLKSNYSAARIHVFDANKLLNEIIAKTYPTQFANTIDQCWTTVSTTALVQNCTNPNDYVFIDEFHYTTLVHKIIATTLQPFFSNSYQDSPTDPYFRVI